ncbi:MAG: hypothetical protein JST26_13100 [Bacteroidetes bacterium]|nr:hypothetical protein [Bacteroidota bacterium]
MKKILAFSLIAFIFLACKTKKNDPDPAPATTTPTNDCPAASCVYPDTSFQSSGSGPKLIFVFKFDSTQARLNAVGQPTPMPSGHAGFSPVFNRMASHYIELAQGDATPLGGGTVLYHANETSCGGSKAIKFCESTVVREGVPFYSVPLSVLGAGTYKWLRISISYQNYDIPYKSSSLPGTQWGTVASFVGYSTYVPKFKVKTQDWIPSSPSPVNGPNVNHPQGYWAFETAYIAGWPQNNGHYMIDGQAPSGATTVVNPLFATSPIPAGSCVVTGQFVNSSGNPQNLTITGTETQDITITVSLSTNKSFEWQEVVADGYYQPDAGEVPVDMGVRGMIPKVQ